MSDTINVVINEQVEPIHLKITEEPKIVVNVLNVATVDPSVANARNIAEASAESAQSAAEAALTVLTQAQEIADNLTTLVQEEISTQIENLTTDNITEGENNLYYTEARVNTLISGKTTDDITEGSTNLYYTDERVTDLVGDTIAAKAEKTELDPLVVGPSSSTDGKVALFNGATGKLLKQSDVGVDSANNVSGVGLLSASSISSNTLRLDESTNSSATGEDAEITVNRSRIILTNSSLESIAKITVPFNGMALTLVNRTGKKITLKHSEDTDGIILPGEKNLTIDNNSSVRLVRSSHAGGNLILDGGTGTGGGEGKTLQTLIQLTADDSLSDWDATSSFAISKTNPLFGDASYVLDMTTGEACAHKVQAVDEGFRSKTLAFTMNYRGLKSSGAFTGTAKVVLFNQSDVRITEWTLPTITTQDQKFGTTFFMPSDATGVRVAVECTSTVSDEKLQFDNIEISSDILKSVDIEGDYQSETLLDVGDLTATTNLASFTTADVKNSGSQIYTKSAQGLTLLRDADVTVIYTKRINANATLSVAIKVDGVDKSQDVSTASYAVTTVYRGVLSKGQKITFIGTSAGGTPVSPTNVIISATARTKSIVAPTDQVSEKTIPWKWKATALVASDPIGTYNTYTYAANTNTKTLATARPTQTDADMSMNGIKIFTRAYNAASTAASPARFEIKIAEPSQMAACDLVLNKNTSRTIAGAIDNDTESSTSMAGMKAYGFNPQTGMLIIDAGWTATTITSHYFIFEDLTTQTNGYLTFTASKLAQGVAIPKTNPVAIIKDVKPSGTTGGTSVALAWQTRTLNTLEDPYGIVSSLVSNRFTLGKGKYLIEASAPSHSTNNHKIVLKEMPSSVTKIVGDQGYSNSSYQGFSFSSLRGFVGISTDTSYEINHYTMGAITSTGLGTAASTGEPEVYTQVTITKLD